MPDWLLQRSRLSPDRPALNFEGRLWSFAELVRRVELLAASLAARGVRAGERVAVLAENSSGYVLLVHALTRLDTVLVPLNVRLATPEIAWQVKQARTGFLVHDAERQPVARQLDLNPDALLSIEELESAANRLSDRAVAPGREEIDLGAVQSVIYTSGTTGRPKGAMLTYGNHWWSAIGSALNLGLHSEDRWLACLPLFHVGGLSILFRTVIYGIPSVLQAAFDPETANRAIEDDGVTIASLVPAMLQRMLEVRGPHAYPPSLRCVLLGGGPAPRPLLEICAERNIPVVQTYGLTEAASQVATLAPQDALRKLGSSGKPLFPTELRVLKDGATAPAGEVGEIVIRGPTVMAGYLGQPRATEGVLPGGWLQTGDLGYLDEEGYLYVVERRDDLIVSGGENVYPAEVEAVLLSHPAVAEAGVTGIPDERWGQVVAAAVALKSNGAVSVEALLDFCRGRLARYKVPMRLEVVDALPRNAAGKLVRSALRELLANGGPSAPKRTRE